MRKLSRLTLTAALLGTMALPALAQGRVAAEPVRTPAPRHRAIKPLPRVQHIAATSTDSARTPATPAVAAPATTASTRPATTPAAPAGVTAPANTGASAAGTTPSATVTPRATTAAPSAAVVVPGTVKPN